MSQGSASDGSKYDHPGWAKVLKVFLEENGVNTWDWILASLVDSPAEIAHIEETCTYEQIATFWAMKTYSRSARPKK